MKKYAANVLPLSGDRSCQPIVIHGVPRLSQRVALMHQAPASETRFIVDATLIFAENHGFTRHLQLSISEPAESLAARPPITMTLLYTLSSHG